MPLKAILKHNTDVSKCVLSQRITIDHTGHLCNNLKKPIFPHKTNKNSDNQKNYC